MHVTIYSVFPTLHPRFPVNSIFWDILFLFERIRIQMCLIYCSIFRYTQRIFQYSLKTESFTANSRVIEQKGESIFDKKRKTLWLLSFLFFIITGWTKLFKRQLQIYCGVLSKRLRQQQKEAKKDEKEVNSVYFLKRKT